MDITFHGSCSEVGRAAMVLEEKGTRLVLDYGVRLNGEITTPLPVKEAPDCAVLSHAHLDHSGALPVIYQKTEIPCFMTPPTLPLAELLVRDSVKVTIKKGLEQIFTADALKSFVRAIAPVGYGKKRVAGDFEFEFHDAGHIVGSAAVLLKGAEHSVFYTGDIKCEKTRLHNGAEIPNGHADVVITESTYGSREHPPRGDLEKAFVAACEETVQKGGNVLCPIFAVNRAQEIACVLNAYGFDYPVYMDGMARDAAQLMVEFPDYVSDYRQMYSTLKWINWVADPVDRKKALAEPSVILSTAGLLQGGPALTYLTRIRDRPNCGIFFTGYQPPDAPGKKLLDEKKFNYHGAELDYSRANILHFDFSAHAGATELQGIIKKLNPGLVIVIHGEAESSSALAQWVNENTKANAIIPKFAERVSIEEHLA